MTKLSISLFLLYNLIQNSVNSIHNSEFGIFGIMDLESKGLSHDNNGECWAASKFGGESLTKCAGRTMMAAALYTTFGRRDPRLQWEREKENGTSTT